MARYHLNPTTGEPGQCSAKTRCPFGDPDSHYASEAEARRAYEALQQDLNLSRLRARKPILLDPAERQGLSLKAYYALPNASDSQGILEHVREKGTRTAGLTPLEAVKKMLREENGMELEVVEQATSVGVEELTFESLAYAQHHYARIAGLMPQPISPHSKDFTGVVLTGKRLRLVDGHHRLKWSREHGLQSGLFIVLH